MGISVLSWVPLHVDPAEQVFDCCGIFVILGIHTEYQVLAVM